MRIIQSAFTKRTNDITKWKCGLWSARYNFYSWVLSSQTAKKTYGNVHLYADAQGIEWLIDRLGIPYDSVTLLDHHPAIPGQLWCYGKVCAYAMQTEPFLHQDSDVFLEKKFSDDILKSDVIAERLVDCEDANWRNLYHRYRELILVNLKYIPDIYKSYLGPYNNHGLFGGSNVEAIQKYSRLAKLMYDHEDNLPVWTKFAEYGIYVHDGVAIEEGSLAAFMNAWQIPVTPILQGGWVKRKNTRTDIGYTHLSGSKLNPDVQTKLEGEVKNQFPEIYRKINEIIPPESN